MADIDDDTVPSVPRPAEPDEQELDWVDPADRPDPRGLIDVDRDAHVRRPRPAPRPELAETSTEPVDNSKGGLVTLGLTVLIIAAACGAWNAEGFIWKLAACVVPLVLAVIVVLGWFATRPTEQDSEDAADEGEEESEA